MPLQDANPTPSFGGFGFTDNSISVALGAGDGSFGLPSTIALPAGARPADAVLGAFNTDATLDLAIANPGTQTVSSFLGTGAGSFASPVNISPGPRSTPTGLTIGDFNRDGNLDLGVVNNSIFESVHILLGDGSGSFSVATTIGLGAGSGSIAAGDFDSDGNLDLAVGKGRSVAILSGDGKGAFGPPSTISISSGATVQSILVADYNADGNEDMAVAQGATNDVIVFLGNGTGSFTAAVTFPKLLSYRQGRCRC